MKTNSFATLMQRLSKAGFRKDFVQAAILPDWWTVACEDDPSLLQEIELRVARFLEVPPSTARDPGIALTVPLVAGTQLRRVRDVDGDRLAPAIHAAIKIGSAVARGLSSKTPFTTLPPPNGILWREQIDRPKPAISLNDILSNLWSRGIPVVPVDILPTPGFQAIACFTEDRPVILLDYKHDEPGRVAFLIAHEVAHLANGDCAPEQPVVDEEEAIIDDVDIERQADQYATHLLVGNTGVPQLTGGDYKQIASQAAVLERETGADAGIIISAWAASTRDYPKATMAWKALYRGSGARRLLRKYFDQYIDPGLASETDLYLLRCIYGDRERDEIIV